MGKNDINFTNKEFKVKFNFRVACIILNEDKILLQKNSKDEYYSLIGGRVKFFEDTIAALIRELKEETGVLINKDEAKLIDVVENFFIYNNTKFHEILFIYKVSKNKELIAINNFKTLDKDASTNLWLDVNQLDKYKIMPTIVKNIIKSDQINHEIIKDY